MKTLKTVARGVDLLNERVPGWEDKINLDKLDISSTCNCVCGQVAKRQGKFWSRFRNGLNILGLELNQAEEYGFDCYGRIGYDRLDDEWSKVIRAKRRGEEITA